MDVKKSINQFLEGNGKNKGRKPDERYVWIYERTITRLAQIAKLIFFAIFHL